MPLSPFLFIVGAAVASTVRKRKLEDLGFRKEEMVTMINFLPTT